jgi:hypothetical protein
MTQYGYTPFFVDGYRNLIEYREGLLADNYNVFFLATPPKN